MKETELKISAIYREVVASKQGMKIENTRGITMSINTKEKLQ